MEKANPSKLLIVTGPQGSGNHLWAKVFSMHPSVNGWPMLKDEWQGHHDEPMNEYWQEPSKLSELELNERNKYVTSISCPYFKNKQPQIPNYADFVKHTKQKFNEVKMCIIGRDRDILEMQQTRVRGEHTTPIALEQFKNFDKTMCEGIGQYVGIENVQYISTELLYLYGGSYLKTLEKNLDFPVAWNHETLIKDYIKKNTNSKYLSSPDKGSFDEEVKIASENS